ncbi:adenylate kinase family protein [Pyrolobus fumarii]|uniref:adenylate kinase family protein n=1 Tax=Pyrolobus fumarii TaxID=54252 RepID=UPI001FCAB583|nr:adenylate kinase family protein [Pyrolobus fumarii]
MLAGTPGTGKTSLAKMLSERYNLRYLSLTEFVLEKGIWIDYDAQRRSFVIDPEGVVVEIRREIRKVYRGVVIETHDLELLWEAGIEPLRVFVLRCRPDVLYNRLLRRGWPFSKVLENIEAELTGVLAWQAKVYFPRVACEIDTTLAGVNATVERIARNIENIEKDNTICQSIDWVSDEDVVKFVINLSLKHSMGY